MKLHNKKKTLYHGSEHLLCQKMAEVISTLES
jgi:hypothetical protein